MCITQDRVINHRVWWHPFDVWHKEQISNDGVNLPSDSYRNEVMEITWWRHQMDTFSALLILCEGNPPFTGGYPSQRPVKRSLIFFFICAWTNGWSNNRDAGDLRRHRYHYDATVMCSKFTPGCRTTIRWVCCHSVVIHSLLWLNKCSGFGLNVYLTMILHVALKRGIRCWIALQKWGLFY